MPRNGVPPQIARAIARLDRACHCYAWRGSGDPDDYEAIEEEYERARQLLDATIARTIRKLTL